MMFQQPQTITNREPATRRPSLTNRLESIRARVTSALLASDEGEADFHTLETISRALVAVTSELGALAVELDTLTHRERMVS